MIKNLLVVLTSMVVFSLPSKATPEMKALVDELTAEKCKLIWPVVLAKLDSNTYEAYSERAVMFGDIYIGRETNYLLKTKTVTYDGPGKPRDTIGVKLKGEESRTTNAGFPVKVYVLEEHPKCQAIGAKMDILLAPKKK